MPGRGLGQHAKFIRENMVAIARPGCNGQYVMTGDSTGELFDELADESDEE